MNVPRFIKYKHLNVLRLTKQGVATMLDQIIENIIQKIRREVVQSGMQDIPLTYIFTRNIPHSIKHFFDQEVELWIREESEKFGSSERFDYEMPEVQMLVDKIFDILKQTATFHINQFNRLLERAIKLEANYLIRPQQTLTQFLFKDSPLITTIEVYDMLKYFDKFQYYKDALNDYFNLKYMREISQNQFQELITAIDQQVYARTPVETALQTLKTINNFINEGRPTSSDSMDVRMMIMVFKDRHLDDFVRLIEQEAQHGTQMLSMSDTEQILRAGKPLHELKKSKPAASTYQDIADIEKAKPEVEVESIDVPEQAPPVAEPESEEFEYEEEYEEDDTQPIPTVAAEKTFHRQHNPLGGRSTGRSGEPKDEGGPPGRPQQPDRSQAAEEIHQADLQKTGKSIPGVYRPGEQYAHLETRLQPDRHLFLSARAQSLLPGSTGI